jgi:hypothetical protein
VSRVVPLEAVGEFVLVEFDQHGSTVWTRVGVLAAVELPEQLPDRYR